MSREKKKNEKPNWRSGLHGYRKVFAYSTIIEQGVILQNNNIQRV